jgi:hypothetical protein
MQSVGRLQTGVDEIGRKLSKKESIENRQGTKSTCRVFSTAQTLKGAYSDSKTGRLGSSLRIKLR